MESIGELAKNVYMWRLNEDDIKRFAGETTSSTLDADGVLATIWSDEVIRKASRMMVCDRFIGRTKVLTGGEEYKLRQRSGMNDGAAMDFTFTEADSLNIYTVDFDYAAVTPTQYGIGVALSSLAIAEAGFDLRQQVTDELSYQLALKRDSYIYNALVPAGASIPAGTNEVFAGADTSIDLGDTFELDYISYALQALDEDNMQSDAMLVTPFERGYFVRTEQFTSAERWGNRSVIETGIVREYVDLSIEYTNNYTRRTAADADFTTDGHDVLIADVARYLQGVTWQPIRLAFHEHPQDDKLYIIGQAIEGWGVMEEEAACIIHCANT